MNPVSSTWLPFEFHEWGPHAQALALGLLTFVQEDVPIVSAALLAAAGNLPWQFGFVGVFFGIWIGDALLYLLARGLGRPLLQCSWAKRLFNSTAIARSEQWFAERGTWLLLSSRFIPGARLTTYLAAGFLRVPLGRFLLVTGIAVAVWTVSIFSLAKAFGSDLLRWLQRWNTGGWAVLLVAIALVIVIRWAEKLAQKSYRCRVRAALGRWARWEFWPAWLFYIPVAAHYVWLAIRFRSLTLPTAANPGIFSGGFVGESKIATLRDLHATSPEFTAEAILLPALSVREVLDCASPRALFDGASKDRKGQRTAAFQDADARANSPSRFTMLEKLLQEHGITYPFILKPDVGQRGVGVKVVRFREQAVAYLQQASAPLLLQRYAPGPHEVGVFYYRFPHEQRGRIFALTEKIFPAITGDGQHTIEELVWHDQRARFIAAKYLRRLGGRCTEVPAPGEVVKLVEAGNHAQGCIFRDGSHLWSEELEWRIDDISQRLGGFFIGRYDIRYSAEADLRAGRNFQIIELNGAASEATSVYDSRYSLFAAYRTLFRQWDLVFAIGAANRRRGIVPTSGALLWRKWRETAALVRTYPLAD